MITEEISSVFQTHVLKTQLDCHRNSVNLQEQATSHLGKLTHGKRTALKPLGSTELSRGICCQTQATLVLTTVGSELFSAPPLDSRTGSHLPAHPKGAHAVIQPSSLTARCFTAAWRYKGKTLKPEQVSSSRHHVTPS